MAVLADEAQRESLRKRIEAKREIERRSLRSVEALLERNITENQLLQHCENLWQQSYQDCTEERALSELCGYPICDNAVAPQSKKMPKYRISLRAKKVYSTDRQRIFCSVRCYERSEWLKAQLSELPLWMVENSFNKKLNLCHDEKNTTDSKKLDGNILPYPEHVSVDEIEQLSQSVDHVSLRERGVPPAPTRDARVSGIAPQPRTTGTEGEEVEDTTVQIFTVTKLEKMLCDWFTISTLHHIVGQARFLELRSEFDRGFTASDRSPDDRMETYERLCLFLSRQERLEGITYSDDDADGGVDVDENSEQQQQQQQQKQQKQTRKAASNNAQRQNKRSHTDQSSRRRVKQRDSPAEREDNFNADISDPVLPPVDKHHQLLIREKIILERLSPLIKTASCLSGVSTHTLARDVAEMIHTFHLTRDNCIIRHDEVVVVFAVIMMLLDRKAGGEGQISKEMRLSLDGSLRKAGLGWGDLCVALQKATNPQRLFDSQRNPSA